MYDTWGDQVAFLFVYIREAHAIDSVAPAGVGPLAPAGGPFIEDPTKDEERHAVAATCVQELSLDPIPTVVDGVDDTVSRAYSAWPDRLYLIDVDGKIAYRGDRGPMGFKPEELAQAIEKHLSQSRAP